MRSVGREIVPECNMPSTAKLQAFLRGLTLLLAVTAGVSAANMYLAQPLIGLIGPSIGLHREAFGLVVTLTQIGYALRPASARPARGIFLRVED